jgi:uncharacterized protein
MQQSGEEQQVRPPEPPFDEETARQKVKAAQDAWNTRDPQKVSLAYTPDSKWRNRDEFFEGREEIVAFLKRKWAREFDENGLMRRRDASINDYKIEVSERKFRWTR